MSAARPPALLLLETTRYRPSVGQLCEARAKHFVVSDVHFTVLIADPSGPRNSLTLVVAQPERSPLIRKWVRFFMGNLPAKELNRTPTFELRGNQRFGGLDGKRKVGPKRSALDGQCATLLMLRLGRDSVSRAINGYRRLACIALRNLGSNLGSVLPFPSFSLCGQAYAKPVLCRDERIAECRCAKAN
jgi:hypothetical protein